MRNKEQGFTLIELMIVLTIIGILSAVAIPMFQSYGIRARVTEGLALAGAAKVSIAETISATQGTPIVAYSGTGQAAAGSYGYEFTPTKDVASVSIAATGAPIAAGDARVTVTYSASFPVPSMILHLVPGSGTVSNGLPASPIGAGAPISWGCDVNGIGSSYRYVPANCRN